MLVYRIDLLKRLKEKGYNTNRLRKEKLLNEMAIQDIRNGKMVGIKSVDKICNILNCQPNYFIKHVPDPEES